MSVKYQMGLAGWGFNRVIADYEREHGGGPVAFSIVCQPGITAGLMFLCAPSPRSHRMLLSPS